MRNNIITRFSIAAVILLSAPVVNAQDIHFTQFDMQPLVINPAFTGMFDGRVRADAIYRNQWASVTTPYVTYGASVDFPLLIERNGDYLATGLQLYNDVAGDGNLTNFTGLVSVAYHKTLGTNIDKSNDLAVGLQGGYASMSIDLSKLYFGDEFNNGTFNPGTGGAYENGLGNHISYYLVNAGICFSHGGQNVSYTLGAAANNINQPNNDLEQKANSEGILAMRFTGEAGLDIKTGERLSLRPAVLYQNQASASELIAGNEFHYEVSNNPGYENFSTAVYVGGWYRTGDAAMITAGVEFKGFRIGVSYDYNISSLNVASNGNGGFELAIKYIMPNPRLFAGKRTIPCTRF